MPFALPPTSKNAVKKASERVSKAGSLDAANPDDIDLIEQWRASHAYVLNTFQALLRARIKKSDIDVEFAQRLKRKKTVFDKIITGRSHDVATMHDLAGCRLIFESCEDLSSFRKDILDARRIKHKLRYDPNKYDYIEHPKITGYRGIHDVYRHFPRDNMDSPWAGLLVEIQYRTRYQHAWATAVEIVDITNGTRTKFQGVEDVQSQYFQVCSEIISRYHECRKSCLPHVLDADLLDEFTKLEARTQILALLGAIREQGQNIDIGLHTVLNLTMDLELEVIACVSSTEAIEKERELFEDVNSLNAVYVKSNNPNAIRSAYRNYFSNPTDFVDLMMQAIYDG